MTEIPETDTEGFLVRPETWTEDVATAFAEKEGIALTDGHWTVIRFMREYWEEHQIAPDVSRVVKFTTQTMGAHRNLLFELFPYGYPAQACKIAGMKRPRAWSTG